MLHPAVLEASHIALSYGHAGRATNVVLRDFSLQLKAGEVVAVLGPSGVGKSSLLRVLAGLQAPDKGGVRVHGESLKGPHPRVGLVFQDPCLLPWLTLEENVGFGVVEGCLKTLRESNVTHAHVNALLDDQEADLQTELVALQTQADALARQAQAGAVAILPVLKLRAAASELALRAANSAVLHAGARGYLMRHPAQRQLREAVFVAIVTPALKHLRKEIRDLEQRQQQAEAA
jgi:ABC-type taurine transport system ATPase subunit